jgi:hypothetical protein
VCVVGSLGNSLLARTARVGAVPRGGVDDVEEVRKDLEAEDLPPTHPLRRSQAYRACGAAVADVHGREPLLGVVQGLSGGG